MNDIEQLTVIYNHCEVGRLKQIDNFEIAFQYSDYWLKNGFSISPFSLPLTNNVFISKSPYFEGLYGVFNDCQPDGWGQLLMIRSLAKKGVDYNKLSPLTKLSLVSKNGLGALEFIPNQFKEKDMKWDYASIAKTIDETLKESETDQELEKLVLLGGSSGGARPKVHIHNETGAWIVKFPNRNDPADCGIKEYEANRIAKECGIHTNDFALFDGKYFAAKRFDRENDRKIHTLSLSSVLETSHRLSNLDYMHLFQVISRISVNGNDTEEAFRRMCFNIFYENRDDHGKNFAFIYDEAKKGYVLSPFYDITHTTLSSEHEMTVLGNGRPNEKDCFAIAEKIRIKKETAAKIINDIKYITKREK